MTNSSSARIAAAGLVAGPLLFTASDLLRRLVQPTDGSASDVAAAVGQHPGLWLAAGLLAVGAPFFLVAGMLGLIAEARGRGARVTVIGAVLVAVGAIASVGHAVAFYSPYALYGLAGTPADAARALDAASEAYPLLIVVIVLFLAGMTLGPLVLFLGLRRAHRVPIWSLVASLVFVACGSTDGIAPGVVGVAAALLAFVPAARSLSRAVAEPIRDPGPVTDTAHPSSAPIAAGARHADKS